MPWRLPGTGQSLCRCAPAAERPLHTSPTALQPDVAVRAVLTEYGRRRPARAAGDRCGSTAWGRTGPSAVPAMANIRPRHAGDADAYGGHAGACLTAASAARDAASVPNTHVSAAGPRPLLRPSRKTAPSAAGAISSQSALAENAGKSASSTSAPVRTLQTCAPPVTARPLLPALPADGSDPALRNGQVNPSAKAVLPGLGARASAAFVNFQFMPSGPWGRCARTATQQSATTPVPAISANSADRSSASPTVATASAGPAQELISPTHASSAA